MCDEFANFVKQRCVGSPARPRCTKGHTRYRRAAIEESYGRSLIKLAKSGSDVQEVGCVYGGSHQA